MLILVIFKNQNHKKMSLLVFVGRRRLLDSCCFRHTWIQRAHLWFWGLVIWFSPKRKVSWHVLSNPRAVVFTLVTYFQPPVTCRAAYLLFFRCSTEQHWSGHWKYGFSAVWPFAKQLTFQEFHCNQLFWLPTLWLHYNGLWVIISAQVIKAEKRYTTEKLLGIKIRYHTLISYWVIRVSVFNMSLRDGLI